MSQESDLDRVLTVSTDDVTVEKSFEPESFPVPAIAFTITAESEEPIEIRLVDHIPEEFPMSAIGFHPDYESENWTAYKDHRVEFERTIHPDEPVDTVYGVRLDREEDAAQFLTEPSLEAVGEDDVSGQVDDVLGEDRNQPVRDVLAGDREALPDQAEVDSGDDSGSDIGADDDDEELDLEDPQAADASEADDEELDLEDPDTESVAESEGEADTDSGPRSVDAGLTPAMVERPPDAEPLGDAERGSEDSAATKDEPVTEGDGEEPISETPGAVEPSEAETHEAPVEVEADVAAEAEAAEATAEHGSDDAATGDLTAVAGGGVAAALATEIREGRVDDDDLEVLREEIDLGVPQSVTVRMKRLQSNVADLDAYTDALEEFIDEEGTAEELIDGFRADLEAVEETLEALESDLETARSERGDISANVGELEEEVAEIEESVDETTSRLETVSSDLSDAETRLTSLDEEVGDVRDDVADLDTSLVDLQEEVSHVDDRLDEELHTVREETEERVETLDAELTDEVDSLRADIEDVRAELEEFEQFRERLGQVFGGLGEGGGADGGNAEMGSDTDDDSDDQ